MKNYQTGNILINVTEARSGNQFYRAKAISILPFICDKRVTTQNLAIF